MTDPEPTPEMIAEMRNTLTRLENGDSSAADEMFPIVYDELRMLAGSRMKRERINHTLRPTALVNEAYAKISGQADASVKSKTHFVAIASLAMQRILVDHARRHKAEKREGSRKREQLHEANQINDEGAVDQAVLEEIAQSVERLAQVDERKATVVRLRMLGGMSVPEVAEVLGIASSTVSSDWKIAKDWIAQELGLEL
jgi:RNA polymerase sigma factor (TIGR02999 family)